MDNNERSNPRRIADEVIALQAKEEKRKKGKKKRHNEESE